MKNAIQKNLGTTHALVTPQCLYAGYSAQKQSGFTLIELLVVVLIIGILAAVALPQYQKAVDKVRIKRIFPTLRALKEAEEVLYLSTGEYNSHVHNLDIDLGIEEKNDGSSSYIPLDENWVIRVSFLSGYTDKAGYLQSFYCPGKASQGYSVCSSNQVIQLRYYFENGPDSYTQLNHLVCLTNSTDKGIALCKALGGERFNTNANEYLLI